MDSVSLAHSFDSITQLILSTVKSLEYKLYVDEMNRRYRTKLLSLAQRFETLHRLHLTLPIVLKPHLVLEEVKASK